MDPSVSASNETEFPLHLKFRETDPKRLRKIHGLRIPTAGRGRQQAQSRNTLARWQRRCFRHLRSLHSDRGWGDIGQGRQNCEVFDQKRHDPGVRDLEADAAADVRGRSPHLCSHDMGQIRAIDLSDAHKAIVDSKCWAGERDQSRRMKCFLLKSEVKLSVEPKSHQVRLSCRIASDDRARAMVGEQL